MPKYCLCFKIQILYWSKNETCFLPAFSNSSTKHLCTKELCLFWSAPLSVALPLYHRTSLFSPRSLWNTRCHSCYFSFSLAGGVSAPRAHEWHSGDFTQTDAGQTESGVKPGSGELWVLIELVGGENCPRRTAFVRPWWTSFKWFWYYSIEEVECWGILNRLIIYITAFLGFCKE